MMNEASVNRYLSTIKMWRCGGRESREGRCTSLAGCKPFLSVIKGGIQLAIALLVSLLLSRVVHLCLDDLLALPFHDLLVIYGQTGEAVLILVLLIPKCVLEWLCMMGWDFSLL